ncbi:MAG: hypothetical protein ACRECW_09065 [Phyllobacterium sp.]
MPEMTRKRILRMVGLQKLVKSRNEMTLSGLIGDFNDIESEDAALIRMQDQRFDGEKTIVSAELVIARIDANARRKAMLGARIEIERANMLRNSRKLDLLDGRLSDFDRTEERATAAIDLDEHMARTTTSKE